MCVRKLPKTIKAYKMLRRDKQNNLHPLFVYPQKIIPIGEWILAEEGERNEDGKVKSRLGGISYRPGLHLSEAPMAPHIGIKDKSGNIVYMHDDVVWCECTVYAEIDYTPLARAAGTRNGRFYPRDACLREIPKDGFYWYNTNPSAFGNWLIAGMMRVDRILDDDEVETICWEQFGIHSMPHRKGA